MQSHPHRLLALITIAMSAPAVYAQDFSPYFETTGRGAYDLYRDTLLCSAVLERALETEPESEQRSELEKGVTYTANFALFLLESGNVVATGGSIRTPHKLAADRQERRTDWQAVLSSLEKTGETPDAEIARCLRLYGHDWE